MADLADKLLYAIQSDDIVAFNGLYESTRCGKYRLGRFPVLSLMYLYNSKKIIRAYEEKFIKIAAYEEIPEPPSVVQRFSKAAGKCLRLYHGDIVSPIEMLLILDKTKKVKALYPLAATSEAIRNRLKAIYYVKYSLNVEFDGEDIVLDRRPLGYREKKKIAVLSAGCALAVAFAVATPITVVAIVNNHKWSVTRLSQIKFESNRTYVLKNDITIPENFSVKTTDCTIEGGGYTINFEKNASLGRFNGALGDVNIVSYGTPIFSSCGKDALFCNATVNVDASVSSSVGTAFIALVNYGTFDDITVNVSGSVRADAGDSDGTEETVFGGMVLANSFSTDGESVSYGTVKNCSVNYSDFSLSGEVMANAVFGGIVGVNDGLVQDCEVSGAISSDTFDIGGACFINYNRISGVVNKASLSQVSEDEGWSPIVGGITVDNISVVELCKNLGGLSATGSDQAICGGISARSYGKNDYCLSSGAIAVTAKTAYVGGIFGISQIGSNENYIYFGTADHCISDASISPNLGEGPSGVGGIVGLVQEAPYMQYGYDAYGWPVAETVYLGGGVTNSIFTGEIKGDFKYFGSVAGVCGMGSYSKNSYVFNGASFVHFDGNYYVSGSPLGAAVTTDEEFVRVDGKGATLSTPDEIKTSETYKEIVKNLGL